MYNKFKIIELLGDGCDTMATIGSRIKTLRETHKLTQSEFGDLFGIVKSTVSSYEHGNSTPDDNIKMAICNYFNISMDYLVGLTDVTHTDSNDFSGFIFQFEFSKEYESLQNKIKEFGVDYIEEKTNIAKEKLNAFIKDQSTVQPSITELTAIANACNCSIDELLGKTKKKQVTPEEQPVTGIEKELLELTADMDEDEKMAVLGYAARLVAKHKKED